ncbi:MAG: protein kinase [Gemmatimonadota bacterium]
MSDARHRLAARFAEALGLDPEARGELLSRVAQEDPDFADELRSLLAAHERADASGFLGPLDEGPASEVLRAGKAPEPVPGEALGRFRILKRLGGGAMGVVHLAEDPRLARRVAIKLLSPWIAADEDARRRFLREARSASRLDHPNVATVHEVGETGDGRPWIVMAYCEGPTLAERLAAGPLPLEEAERILTEIVSGIAAAHQLGIVHRDVKPGNVVLTESGARVLDFGIAQVDGAAATGAGPLGTLPYMSPEQTRGGEVDARTDVWALGAVGYEILTGHRPFEGPHDAALIHRIREEAPEPVAALRPEAPDRLVRVVEACLAKDPQARPSSATEVLTVLRAGGKGGDPALPWRRRSALRLPLLLGTVAMVTVILGPRAMTDRSAPSPPLPEVDRSIAVLPFESIGGGEEAGIWARGLQDDLLTGLAGVPSLRVTSRRASDAYDAADDPQRVARELGVRLVVEGTVQTLGEELRLNLRVVDPLAERQAWAESYRAELTAPGLLRLGGEALADLFDWLEVDGAAHNAGARITGPDDLATWRRYIEGRIHLEGRTEVGLRRAEEEFRAVVEGAPAFAEGWSGLADALVLQALFGYADPAEVLPGAREAAGRAIELRPDLPEAHATMGLVVMTLDRDGPGALWWLRRAVAMQPSNALAQQWLGALLASLGQLDEAGVAFRRAVALEPNAPAARLALARWYLFADSLDLALEWVRAAEALEPGGPVGALLEGEVLRQLGRREEAREVLRRARELPGVNPTGFPGIWAELAAVNLELGDTLRSRELVAEIGRDMPPFVLGATEAGLGDWEAALELLAAAPVLPVFTHILRYHPLFDPIRGDPRMEAILQRYDSAWGIASPR